VIELATTKYYKITCLYETDRLVVYRIFNEKNLVIHKSVSNLSNIKFFHWHHLPNKSQILIVHGPFHTDLSLWNLNEESFKNYQGQNKILDVAFSNEESSDLIAITTEDKMIEILNKKFGSLLKFSEVSNQKIIFLDRDNIFVCGQQGSYSHGYKAISLKIKVRNYFYSKHKYNLTGILFNFINKSTGSAYGVITQDKIYLGKKNIDTNPFLFFDIVNGLIYMRIEVVDKTIIYCLKCSISGSGTITKVRMFGVVPCDFLFHNISVLPPACLNVATNSTGNPTLELAK